MAEDRGPLRADRVHNRAQIVHALLEGRQICDRDGIREPGAPLVEQDQPRERGEPFEKPPRVGSFPHLFDVRGEPRNVHEVDRALPDHLKGDVHVAALRVARVRDLHSHILSTRHLTSKPPGRCVDRGVPSWQLRVRGRKRAAASAVRRPEPVERVAVQDLLYEIRSGASVAACEPWSGPIFGS